MRKLSAVLLAIVSVFAFVFFAAGSGKTDADNVPIEGEEEVTTEVAAEEIHYYGDENYPEDDEFIPEDIQVEIGQYYFIGDYRVTYLDCGPSTIHQPSAGKEIIYIELFIENNSNMDLVVTAYDFVCLVDDGNVPVYSLTDDDYSSVRVKAQKTRSVRVYFEVPEDSEIVTTVFNPNSSGANQALFVYE